jgi:hypothetical protein
MATNEIPADVTWDDVRKHANGKSKKKWMLALALGVAAIAAVPWVIKAVAKEKTPDPVQTSPIAETASPSSHLPVPVSAVKDQCSLLKSWNDHSGLKLAAAVRKSCGW